MRGFGRIFKRGAVYWIAYYHRGREYRESTEATKESVARRRLKDRWKALARGKAPGTHEERVTVEEILRDLENDHRIKRRASLRTVLSHNAALLDALGDDAHAIDVTAASFRETIATWQREKVADATINRRRSTLLRAFSLAQEAGKLVTIPKLPKLAEDNARQGFFDKGTFQAVLAQLPDDGLRDFVEWAYWTGMRKGEIAGLTWTAYDREAETVRLHARDTKNRKPRRIVLAGPLKAIIGRRVAARRADCRFIFHRKGEPICHFRRSWLTACKAAGVAGRLFHDLRRTGVRNLIRAGVSRSVAMKISGHKTESVFERYNIDADDDLRQAVERVSVYVDQLPDKPAVVPLPRSADSTVRVLSENGSQQSATEPNAQASNA